MTEPALAQSKGSRNGVRRYAWPQRPPHEFNVTSVTSAIKGGLPKPFLEGWAAKITAETAVKDHDIIKLMLEKSQEKQAIQHLKGSRYASTGSKGDVGNVVHDAIDRHLGGNPMSEEEVDEDLDANFVPKAMRPAAHGKISGVLAFLADSEMDVVHHEITVYNQTHGYAGTPDIVGSLQSGGAHVPAIVDIKTGKAIYDDTALQLGAYARGEWASEDGSTKLEMPDNIRHGVVVRPKGDGTYERGDFALSDEVFEMFLACLGVANAQYNGVLDSARIRS